jgi:uncharacterized protein (TIGR02594 family)
MSYETALQRITDLRTQFSGAGANAGATSTAVPGAFDAQLATQQAQLAAMSTGEDGDGGADGDSSFSQFNLPVLTVADQYRMMGITPAMAGGFFPTGTGAGARMVALAQREIGVGETSGNNESPRIREYRSATAGAENTPGPWCSYFVSYLAKEAGAPIGPNGNGTGYVPTLQAWGKQEGRYHEYGQTQPNPGDIVIFDWDGGGLADHTGIVERVDPDGTIHTIEGNSSDAVKRRSYDSSTNDIAGFVSM